MNNHVFRKKLFYQNLLSAMNIAPLLGVFAVERSSVEVTSTESSTLINQSRTSLVTKVVRVWYANSYEIPFRKFNFQTTIMERIHYEQQTFPICYIEFRGRKISNKFVFSLTKLWLSPKLGGTSTIKIKTSFYFVLSSVCTNFAAK